MADNNIRSLDTLPVEFVYLILDNLNKFNILYSMRNVCTRLNQIVDTYHWYKVKFSFRISRIFKTHYRRNKQKSLTHCESLLLFSHLYDASERKKNRGFFSAQRNIRRILNRRMNYFLHSPHTTDKTIKGTLHTDKNPKKIH